jgi:hypothetical protein
MTRIAEAQVSACPVGTLGIKPGSAARAELAISRCVGVLEGINAALDKEIC